VLVRNTPYSKKQIRTTRKFHVLQHPLDDSTLFLKKEMSDLLHIHYLKNKNYVDAKNYDHHVYIYSGISFSTLHAKIIKENKNARRFPLIHKNQPLVST